VKFGTDVDLKHSYARYIVTCLPQVVYNGCHSNWSSQQCKCLFTTVAMATNKHHMTFSMWSDPSLLRNNGKAAFPTKSVPRQQWEGRSWAI
jgi:hypothetical protein